MGAKLCVRGRWGTGQGKLVLGGAEEKTKHLEFILAAVGRMANNSFVIKGWSVTLVSALFALAAKDAERRFVVIAYFPTFLFWALNGYFLSKERAFRVLYDRVRGMSPTAIDFSLDIKSINDPGTSIMSAIFSPTLLFFHGSIALTVLIVMFSLCR